MDSIKRAFSPRSLATRSRKIFLLSRVELVASWIATFPPLCWSQSIDSSSVSVACFVYQFLSRQKTNQFFTDGCSFGITSVKEIGIMRSSWRMIVLFVLLKSHVFSFLSPLVAYIEYSGLESAPNQVFFQFFTNIRFPSKKELFLEHSKSLPGWQTNHKYDILLRLLDPLFKHNSPLLRFSVQEYQTFSWNQWVYWVIIDSFLLWQTTLHVLWWLCARQTRSQRRTYRQSM